MDTELNAIMNQLLGEMQQLNRTIGKTGASGAAAAADQSTTQFGNLLNKGMSKVFDRAGKAAEDAAKKAARAAERNAGPHRASDVKAAGDKAGVAAFSAHVEKIGSTSKALHQSLVNLGKSLGSVHANIMKGDTGTAKYAEMTATAAQGALSVAGAFGKLNPVVGLAAQALIKFAVAAAKQGDDQFKVYQQLQEAGASTADDLDGVNDMLTKFGLTAVEAEKVLGLIASTAPSLAMFRDNVGDGAKAMAKLSKNFEPLRGQLTELGISVEEQRAQMFSYMEAQAKIQGRGVKISNETTEAMAKYMLETNALTKLTGATRQQQEDAQRKALQREQLASRTRKARQSNDPAERAAAERDLQTYKTLTALAGGNDEVANAVQSLASGMTTESGLALQRLTGGEAGQIAQNKDMTPAEQAEAISKAIGRALDKTGNLADAEAFKKAFGIDFAMLDSVTQRSEDLVRRNQAVTADNAAQLAKEGGGVKAGVQTQEADINYKTNVEKFVQYGVEPMMKGMSMVATGLSKLSDVLPGKTAKGSDRYGGAVNNTGNLTPLPAGTPGAPTGTGTPGQRGSTNPPPTGPRLGAGPVFGSHDMTWNNKVLLTLEEMRDEIKKLTKMGAIASGPAGAADMTAAMNAHDASHKHEPPTITPDAAAALGKGMGSPLKDLKVTSGFGMRTDPITGKQAGHGGVDLAGKIGDAIMAPDSGIARVVGEAQSGGYGNMVEILNEQGKVIHRMAHMSEALVKTGDKITAGSQIGKVGSTGRSTGAHLHWEQFDPTSGKQIDPMAALAAKQGQTTQVAGATPGGVPGMPTAPVMSNSELKGQQKEFYDKLYSTLLDQATKAGVKNPEAIARLGAAQSSLETGYGKATAGGNNFFGIKGSGGNQQSTQEFDPKTGKMVTQQASFRQYGSMEESAADYIKLLQGNKRYSGVLGAGSTSEAIAAQGRSGYATDPDYARKLAMITSSATGQGINLPGGIAGPTGMPTPYAAAPGATNALPPTQVAAAAPPPMAPPAGGFDPTMLAQLVAINREQNVLLGRILQTSQA